MRYEPKRLIIPIIAQLPLFFQLPLDSLHSFLLILKEFQEQICFACRICNYLRGDVICQLECNSDLNTVLSDVKIG